MAVPQAGIPRHPAWIEVDHDALASNARVLREIVPRPARLGIVVKDNGYGHGAVGAALAALTGGADTLVVAAFEEAIELRAAGIDAPILSIYPVAPQVVGAAADAGLELSVSGLESARQLATAWRTARAAAPGGALPRAPLRVHVEVDTGMARGGARPDRVPAAFDVLEAAGGVQVVGLWTHLADAASRATSGAQVGAFEDAIRLVRESGRRVPACHVAASEGLLGSAGPTYDLVRIGLAFYGELGLEPAIAPELAAAAGRLRPAMTIKARAVHLEAIGTDDPVGYGGDWRATRPSLIATLPIGYGDGWSRQYAPGGWAIVRGRRVPIVGRISMDATSVDVTDAGGVTLDDDFVLLGRQGTETITVNELARLRRSIPNEVLAVLGPRLPRVPVRHGARAGSA